MSISTASRIRNEMCYIRICIDEHENGDIRGRLFNAYYKEALIFDNGMDMIRQLDEIFNTFGYPHATMDLRSFEGDTVQKIARKTPTRVRMAPSVTLYTHNANGRLATLRLRVMFRQNASWQGNIKWVEEELEENFQSVLELMLLIDSVFDEE